MTGPVATRVVRRHSLLRRNAAHDRAHFSNYYETDHGPLAASQAGFRKYTTRYIQNHVEAPGPDTSPFDGVTMTTQVPRLDYSKGFFTEPDYENVKRDEMYLFDLDATVSMIGEEDVIIDGPKTPFKVLVLAQATSFTARNLDDVSRLVINVLDQSTASALGFRAATFPYEVLAEIWFVGGASRDRAVANPPAGEVVLAVREVEIFGPDKPWSSTTPR